MWLRAIQMAAPGANVPHAQPRMADMFVQLSMLTLHMFDFLAASVYFRRWWPMRLYISVINDS